MTIVRKPLVALVAAALVLLAGVGCNAVAPYAAKVNGERITVSQLNRELKAIKGNEEYVKTIEAELGNRGESVFGTGQGTFGSVFVAETLTRRIYLALVHQEVERRGLRPSKEKLAEARRGLAQSPEEEALLAKFPKAYVDELVRASAEVNALRQNLTNDVSDADIQKFYDENPQYFEQTCARQIVTGGYQVEPPIPPALEAQAKATADDIKARLDAGGDFAAIATAESKDPRSAPQGGDLGCVTSNAFPPEVAASVENTEPGKVAGPVRTDRGFYLVLVQSRQMQPLEEVSGQIRQFLESQSGDPLNQFLTEALAKAKVSVNPRYGTFDAAGERPSVVPPEAPSIPAPPAEPGPEDGPPVQ